MIHSLAECQATAHQETVFSVLHRKVRLPPESVPAASLYPEADRLFPAPLQAHLLKTFFKTFFKTFVETFLYKTFCKRHAVCSAPAGKKPGILPGCDALISE
ncbi:hypothetical protein BCD23_004864 [Escherichia coli]|nr:hypothetical protein [Escherichia coli]